MKKLIFVLLMFVLVTSATFAQEKPTVVIVPFDTVGVDENESNVLFEVFTSYFAGLGKTRVVDRNSFDKIKAEHSFQTSDWSNSDKVAQLGKALNANLVVVGQLMSFKGSLVATFRMLDVNTVEIVATATERTSGTDELFGKLEVIAKKLIANLNTSSDSVKTSYEIGDDGPGGGIVFYYSEDGFDVYEPDGSVKRCNYLEVAKKEITCTSWCTRKAGESCCYVGTKTGLGRGKNNTYDIMVSSHKSGPVNKSNCAAYACYNYSTPTSKVGDWFLPNMEELKFLYKNLSVRERVSSFLSSGWIWSSDEESGEKAYEMNFLTGESGAYSKHNKSISVIAIRAF